MYQANQMSDQAEDQSVGAVIVAAGQSRRMGGADKVALEVAGKPVVA